MNQDGPQEIATSLLAWYAKAGRDLPWRRSRDPYRVWIAEIMLQQTGVAAVIPYYERFLARFPDVSALAAASVDDVIALWAGLGYYSRARNLHAAARHVLAEHDGAFPADLPLLTALPGIGRSTAGAILSIAFDRKAPILDGNVRRVLARLFALREDPRRPAAEKNLWNLADALTPADRPHDYAQAIMDLGATVCVPRQPACDRCPLAELCHAKVLGLERQLPVRGVKKAVPTVTQVALLLVRDGRFLVRKRPFKGMLGGLWEFPAAAVAAGLTPSEAAAALLCEMGGSETIEFVGGLQHAYSHFKLDLHLFRAAASAERVCEAEGRRWLSASELAGWPLHGAHKKALALID